MTVASNPNLTSNPSLLLVQASPRGEHSISRNLARTFVAQWQATHPGGKVVQRDLADTALPYVTAPWLGASLTPAEQHTPAMKAELQLSDALVAELLAADHIAISTPVYNYNVPANLKAWVDHIVRKGLTLGSTGEGLVRGKKATVLMASGGVYTEGSPIRERDIASNYLRLILQVIGIDDVTSVAAGGTKVVDLGQQPRAEFLQQVEPAVLQAVAAAAL